MRGGIAGCATFLVTGYRNRPVRGLEIKNLSSFDVAARFGEQM